MWKESPTFSSHPLDLDKFRNLGNLCIGEPLFMGLVAVHDMEVVGFWGGSIQSFWYSDDTIVRDYVFYVTPKHRGSSAAYRLIKAAELWALNSGVSHISIGLSSAVDTDKTSCFFKKMGYTHNVTILDKRL